jgi:hypothetical protein
MVWRSGIAAMAGVVLVGLGTIGGAGAAQAGTPGGLARAGAGASAAVSGGASSSAVSPAKVKPGSEWTIEVDVPNDNSCEVITFADGGLFTGDLFSDQGTYSVTGTKLKMTWTSGDSAGLKFKGTYNAAKKRYKGTFGGYAKGDKGQLVDQVLSTWDGSDC